MEGFELSIVLDRPIEDVFGFLSNLENDLKWRREWVEAVKTSEGPIGVDSTFRLVGAFLGRKIPTEYKVTEYERNRSAAWKSVLGPLPMTFWRKFEPVEGGTRFTIRYEAELHGFFKLVMPLLAGSVKRQHEGDLRKVKELLEAHTV